MKSFIQIVVIVFFSIAMSAQNKFNKIWYTGGGRTFRSQFTNSGVVNVKIDSLLGRYFADGSSSICDSNGNIILCSNGFSVMGADLQYLDGGYRLMDTSFFNFYNGKSIYSQSSIILPFDSSNYLFVNSGCSKYVFDNVWLGTNSVKSPFDLLFLSKVDMKLNNGAGKVTERMKPIVQGEFISKTQMMACRHANGKDWWLLKMMHDSVSVYTFLITKDSVYSYGKQSFPYARKKYSGVFFEIMGQIQFSRDGKKFAATCNNGHNELFLADFDRCTGQLSNMIKKNIPILPTNFPVSSNDSSDKYSTGLCFSPNGRFIYTINYANIQQFDTWAPDSSTAWHHVANMDTVYNYFMGYSMGYLGWDDKLYIGNWNGLGKTMSVIDSPDNKGISCSWCPKCMRFPDTLGGATNPPCQPNYNLGKDTSINCWPVAIENTNSRSESLSVYPNPTSGRLIIRGCNPDAPKELFSQSGQLLLRTKENELDLSRFTKGIYLLRCEGQLRKVVVE